MELSEAIRRRRMVRAFTREAITSADLDAVLEVMRHAPSAGFTQGLDLLVLHGEGDVTRFWETTFPPAQRELLPTQLAVAAPVVVLPLVSRQAYLDRYSEPDKAAAGMQEESGWPIPYWHVDAGMAVMLALLTAVERGLGAWFFAVVHGERELLGSLGVPAERRLLGALALGHAAQADGGRGSAATRPRRSMESMLRPARWVGRSGDLVGVGS